MNKWKKTFLFGAGATGALAIANAVIASRATPPGLRLGGSFARYPFRQGDTAYTVAGSGAPVLLLPGFGAGNSMTEWAENFDALRQHHTVYAMDFLGWGWSDRPHRIASAQDMIEQIRFFLEDIVKQPCALVASSDSCALAIEAARQTPELVSKLVLVCPSAARDDIAVPVHETWLRRAAQSLFTSPIIGQSLVNAVASRRSIKSFCQHHLYFDKNRVDEKTIDRYYSSAHEPDAKYGLAAFVSGALSHDARAAWSEIAQPSLLIWGRNARINPLETAPEWLALNPDARLEVIDNAMLLPHQERAAQWNSLVLNWLK